MPVAPRKRCQWVARRCGPSESEADVSEEESQKIWLEQLKGCLSQWRCLTICAQVAREERQRYEAHKKRQKRQKRQESRRLKRAALQRADVCGSCRVNFLLAVSRVLFTRLLHSRSYYIGVKPDSCLPHGILFTPNLILVFGRTRWSI